MSSGQEGGGGQGRPVRPAGSDLIIPLLAAVFALYFLWDTRNLVWEARLNGVLIIVPLLGLVVFQVGRILLSVRSERSTLAFGELLEWNVNQRKRLLLLAIFFGLAITINHLGVTLALFLSLLGCLSVLGVSRPIVLTLVPTLTALSVYLLFIALLDKRMPHGPIEWLLAPLFNRGAF